MNLSFNHILHFQIAFGIAALITFWIPLIAKKGSWIHIYAGRTYIAAMSLVALSAGILCSFRLIDPHSSIIQIQFAWFLLFISILASSSAWYAIRAWRFQKRNSPHYNGIDLGIAVLLLISSIAMSWYGYWNQNYLFTIFPLIGLFLSLQQLHYWLTTPKIKMHAWFQHMNGMFSCVISTLTAFAVVGFPSIMKIERLSWILWFGPTMILVPILLIWQNYYRRKFGKLAPPTLSSTSQ